MQSKAGYETQYWSFITENWPVLFSSYAFYDSVMRLRRKLGECKYGKTCATILKTIASAQTPV
eukprot:1869255-Lingulodinium_polyedra.AAC.1